MPMLCSPRVDFLIGRGLNMAQLDAGAVGRRQGGVLDVTELGAKMFGCSLCHRRTAQPLAMSLHCWNVKHARGLSESTETWEAVVALLRGDGGGEGGGVALSIASLARGGCGCCVRQEGKQPGPKQAGLPPLPSPRGRWDPVPTHGGACGPQRNFDGPAGLGPPQGRGGSGGVGGGDGGVGSGVGRLGEGGAPVHAAAIGAGWAVVSCRNHMAPAFPWREPGWALPRACTNSPLAPVHGSGTKGMHRARPAFAPRLVPRLSWDM